MLMPDSESSKPFINTRIHKNIWRLQGALARWFRLDSFFSLPNLPSKLSIMYVYVTRVSDMEVRTKAMGSLEYALNFISKHPVICEYGIQCLHVLVGQLYLFLYF